jgi:hypothetical protein
MRSLSCSLFSEGRSDALFLADVLTRQLRELLWTHAVQVERVVAERRRTVEPQLALGPDVIAAAQSTNLVFVHHDHNEAGKIEKLRSRIAADFPSQAKLIALVPKRETEAWCLADPAAISRVPRADRTLVPHRAAEVEKLHDPKAVLAKVLGTARLDDALELLAANVSLDRLAEVPAYQNFLQDLTTALKELNFL